MRPLCRIFSISLADLQTIAMCSFLRVMVFQNPEDLLGDIIHRQIAIHTNQAACALIIIRYGTRLLLKRRKSWLNHFQPVVVAGYQLRPMRLIAHFIESGRLEVDVIDPSTGGTRTSSSNPEQQLIIVHVKADHNWPGAGGTRVVKELIVEQGIEPAGLSCSSGKAIEDVAQLAIGLHQAFPDHGADQVVANQLTPSHDRLGSQAEFGSQRDILPEKISGRYLGNLVVLHDALGLGALTGTRRPEQHNGANVPRGFLRHRLAKASRSQSPRLPGVFSRGAATSTNLSGPIPYGLCQAL